MATCMAGHPEVAVVLVGVNNLGHGQSPADTAAGIAAAVGAIRSGSPGTKVLLLGLLPTHAGLFFDGLHPSATGYGILADAIVGPIQSLLSRTPTEAVARPSPTAEPAASPLPLDTTGGATGGGPIWIGVSDPSEAIVLAGPKRTRA